MFTSFFKEIFSRKLPLLHHLLDVLVSLLKAELDRNQYVHGFIPFYPNNSGFSNLFPLSKGALIPGVPRTWFDISNESCLHQLKKADKK